MPPRSSARPLIVNPMTRPRIGIPNAKLADLIKGIDVEVMVTLCVDSLEDCDVVVPACIVELEVEDV